MYLDRAACTDSMQMFGCPVRSATPVRNLDLRVEISWVEAFPTAFLTLLSCQKYLEQKCGSSSELEEKQEGQGSERERNCLTVLFKMHVFQFECHHFLLEVFESQG